MGGPTGWIIFPHGRFDALFHDDRHWRLDHCARARRSVLKFNKMRKPAVYNGKRDAFFFSRRADAYFVFFFFFIFWIRFFPSLLSLSLSLSLSFFLFFASFSSVHRSISGGPLRVVNTREFLPVAITRLFMSAIAQSADSVIRELSVARLME